MTPAVELEAAAELLEKTLFRGAITMTPSVAALIRSREPLAKWLRETAYEIRAVDGTEYALHSEGCPFSAWDSALETARALLGTEAPGSEDA
jgi:altronate dehydratase